MSEFVRLARLAAGFKWWILLATVLGTGTVGAGIGLMATSAYLISAAALHPSIAELNLAIVGVRFFGITRGGLRYAERLASHSVSLRLLTDLRVRFYAALEPIAPAGVQQLQSGDLMARAVADIDTLQDFYVRVLAPPLVALGTALVMGLFLWQYDARLVPVLLTAWLIAGLGVPAGVRRAARSVSRRWIEERAAMHAGLVDAVQGIADITAFGQGEAFRARAEQTSAAYASAQMRLATVNALQGGASTLLSGLTMVAILVVSTSAVNEGAFSAVYLASLALATLAAFEAVTPLGQSAQALESALAAGKRLLTIIDMAPAPSPEPLSLQEAASATGHPLPSQATVSRQAPPLLEIDSLRFAYPGAREFALKDISFAIPRGHKVAIVGPSGAGKTSVANLLARFWEYDGGEIRLEGIPLKQLSPEAARERISFISQQTYLFNATARENLQLARPAATPDEIEQAARHAQIHAFLSQLPAGYETPIGERGAALSGGERQRLGVARALLRDTPLLVLDEPTANLDAETERGVLHEIFSAMRGRGLLLLTHRLVSLQEMDEILVLDHGCVVERGTHYELVRRPGLYARMWELQNQPLRQRIHPGIPDKRGDSDDHLGAAARIPVFCAPE